MMVAAKDEADLRRAMGPGRVQFSLAIRLDYPKNCKR